MKTVWQFSSPFKVSFRCGRRAQSTGSILFSVYTKCLATVADSKSATHPEDWPADTAHAPLGSYSPEFDVEPIDPHLRRARWGHD